MFKYVICSWPPYLQRIPFWISYCRSWFTSGIEAPVYRFCRVNKFLHCPCLSLVYILSDVSCFCSTFIDFVNRLFVFATSHSGNLSMMRLMRDGSFRLRTLRPPVFHRFRPMPRSFQRVCSSLKVLVRLQYRKQNIFLILLHFQYFIVAYIFKWNIFTRRNGFGHTSWECFTRRPTNDFPRRNFLRLDAYTQWTR